MAAESRAAKPSFHAVVFQGKPKVVRAFLHGLTLGAEIDATLYFCYTEGIHDDSTIERLAEKFGLRAADCHVVVDEKTSDLLKSLRKQLVEETGLEIVSHRKVKSATMAFRYKAYTPRHDEEILEALRKLPAGTKLRGFKHDRKTDPSARGVEAYSPTHEFEAWGEGALSGPVDKLVELKRRVAEFPLIETDRIELVFA
jgi:hypothetical protein